ncbi:MAG: FAD-binding oxidoreductase, partial [Pseudomonadota bacterium]
GHENLITDSMYVHAFRDSSRASLVAIDYRIRSEKGADLELVGQDRLAEIEPALSPEFEAAILIKGQARMRSPGRLGSVLAEKAHQMGATFRRSTVTRISRANTKGWSIQCNDETLNADRIVLCMGAWSPKLLKSLGVSVPLLAERGYNVEFENPGVEINNSVMDVDAKVVASSMESGVRVAGQAEFAPVDMHPNKRRQRQLTKVAQSIFPELQTERPTFWMGRRPSFPDSLPALGTVDGHPGLFVNFGHSHYGLMMSPRSGEIIAQLLCEEHLNLPLDDYSLNRF